MSIRYHCDICEAQRDKTLLENLALSMNHLARRSIDHVCPACRDALGTAFDNAMNALRPRVRVPIAHQPKERDEGF